MRGRPGPSMYGHGVGQGGQGFHYRPLTSTGVHRLGCQVGCQEQPASSARSPAAARGLDKRRGAWSRSRISHACFRRTRPQSVGRARGGTRPGPSDANACSPTTLNCSHRWAESPQASAEASRSPPTSARVAHVGSATVADPSRCLVVRPAAMRSGCGRSHRDASS